MPAIPDLTSIYILMNKVTLLLAVIIFAHMHSIWLLHRNLETGDWLKISWAAAELVWGIWLLQQVLTLFKHTYLKQK